MAWYVAKIVGKHPQWGFAREFLRNVDPENPEFPGDGLYEVQTRVRTYYIVENGEAREITKKEAQEIIENMQKEGGGLVDTLPIEVGEAIRRTMKRNKEVWDVAKKDGYPLAQIRNWEGLKNVIKDWAEEYRYSDDERDIVMREIVRILGDVVHYMIYNPIRYAGDKQRYLTQIRTDLLAWYHLGVLRSMIRIILVLPKEEQDNAVARLRELTEELLSTLEGGQKNE